MGPKLILPVIFLVIAVFVVACGGSQPTASPVSQNGQVETIVAGTLEAILSATPEPTITLTPTETVQAGWVRYTNEQFGFQLDHPGLFDCKDQCGIGAFINTGDIQYITTFAIESTMMQGTDAPFDGISVDVFLNPQGISLQDFAEQEKKLILTGPGLIGPPTDIISFTAGGQAGVSMTLMGSISRAVYIPIPNSDKILIFSIGNHQDGSFEATADQILATLTFTGGSR